MLLFLLFWLAPQRWPIQSLSVEGNHLYTSEQILRVAGLKVGQLAAKEDFEAARERLNRTGAFETVGFQFGPSPDKKGYTASFQVLEVEPVYPLRFEDLGVPDQEVLAWLRGREPLLRELMPGTKAVVDRYVQEIEALLASRQRPERIAGKVTPTGPDQFVLLFRPARAIPSVAQVSFTGNQVVTTNALQDAITGVGIGALYTEPRFRELLDSSVRPLYEARGHIRVAWKNIDAQPAKDVNGLHITVTVDEGPAYNLGKVMLEGTAPLRLEDLMKAAKFKPGETADFDAFNQAVDRVRLAFRHNGFLKVETDSARKIDDKAKTVDVTVHVRPGPQFLMGKLDIQGLDLHGEAAIRKMWGLKEGKPFRGDYPEFFLNRVREEGLFDNLKNTKSNVKVNEAGKTVDVTLLFQ